MNREPKPITKETVLQIIIGSIIAELHIKRRYEMDKTLLELLKEAKAKEEKKMNGSQEQKTEDRQQIFNAGFQMGIQYKNFFK